MFAMASHSPLTESLTYNDAWGRQAASHDCHTSKTIERIWRFDHPHPNSAPGVGLHKQTDRLRRWLLRTTAAPAAALVAAIAFGAMLAPTEASAGEYCRQDVTGHMTGCGFETMEQCQAMRNGLGGECFRDPWIDNNRNAGNASTAYAYQPRVKRSKHHVR